MISFYGLVVLNLQQDNYILRGFWGIVRVTGCAGPINGVSGVKVWYDAGDMITTMNPCPPPPRFLEFAIEWREFLELEVEFFYVDG